MKIIEFQYNKKRILKVFLIHIIALTFGSITTYILYNFDYISITLIIFLAFFMLIFPYLLYLNLKILMNKEPGLILNEKGVINNTQNYKSILLEWQNIESYNTTIFFHNKFLLLNLKNNTSFLNQLSKRNRKISEDNIKKFGTPFLINLSNLQCDYEKIIKTIEGNIIKS